MGSEWLYAMLLGVLALRKMDSERKAGFVSST